MKNTIILIIVVVLIGLGVYFINKEPSSVDVVDSKDATTTEETQLEEEKKEVDEGMTIIGQSVEERDITAYHYGGGDTEILLVGGIHGGYSWNTSLVAFEAMDYFEANPDVIPENVKVTVVPVLNPDGLDKIVGTAERFTKGDVSASLAESIPGRFNENNVDLNRNFECDWQSEGTWQSRTVSGGDRAFSEPESQAIREYIEKVGPDAVVVYYSAAGGVFASSCHNGVLPETLTLTNLYADASGYKAYESFDFYNITGDMVNWLANNDIPAISVLLTTHTDVEWSKNKAGIEALLENYTN